MSKKVKIGTNKDFSIEVQPLTEMNMFYLMTKMPHDFPDVGSTSDLRREHIDWVQEVVYEATALQQNEIEFLSMDSLFDVFTAALDQSMSKKFDAPTMDTQVFEGDKWTVVH